MGVSPPVVGWGEPVSRAVATVALVVREYDEAVAYFTVCLGFHLLEDTPLGGGKRWVVVAPPGGAGAALLLARASTPEQLARVGDQTGGRVFLFLHTDDFYQDHAAMQARGVEFVEPPRGELRYGGRIPRPVRQPLGPDPAGVKGRAVPFPSWPSPSALMRPTVPRGPARSPPRTG